MRYEFGQKIIDKIRRKKKISVLQESLLKNNSIRIDKNILDSIVVNISGGTGNVINIGNVKLSSNAKIDINIFGSNNEVTIEDGFLLGGDLCIYIGQNHYNFGEVENHKLHIGKNVSIENMRYVTFNSNSYCNIGSDCMLAFGIEIYNTDAHPVFDFETGEIINKVYGIDIGNHCWLGAKSSILKNTRIADDCIVGWGSVVSGKFDKEHSVIAGNPGRIVKEGITWNSNGNVTGYIKNEHI